MNNLAAEASAQPLVAELQRRLQAAKPSARP
jgi:hypothetical protein